MRSFSVQGGPDEHPQECAPDAAQSSRAGAAGAGRGRRPWRWPPPWASDGQNGRQVGRPASRPKALAGLIDRSSRPHRLYRPTPEATAERIEALRRQRWTGKQIAQETRRLPGNDQSGSEASRPQPDRRDLEPAVPILRYERKTPGEMIHIDIKKLGRFDRVGHRITGDRTGQSNSSRQSAGSLSMSRSTTPRASLSPRSCPTRRKRAPSPS